MAVGQADASGGDIRPARRGQNERHSEAAGEEQPENIRKTVRLEQEAPSAAASPDPTVALEYPASGDAQDRPLSVFGAEVTSYS